MKSSAARFCGEETGAVTVDWVVLTGALVGLGLAVVGVVSNGLESLSAETSDEIAGTGITTRFASAVALFSSDFANGRDGFVGGLLENIPGFGDILTVGPNEMASLTLDVPPGSTSATISFDLIAADDFDGDTATIWVNGEAVSLYTDNDGNISINDTSGAGVTVSVDQQYTNSNVGGGSLDDSRATYSITVDNPGSSVSFGVSSNASAGRENEFFALDGVEVTAE